MGIASVALCILYAILNVAGAALVKIELQGRNLSSLHDYVNLLLSWRVAIGFALIFFSALVMFKALSGNRFSIVIPIAVGVNFVLTVCVGIIIFHDKISLQSFLGMFFIFSGVLLMAFAKTI